MKEPHRKLIAKLRCSSSDLSIEKERWDSINREDRKCRVCDTDQVEDEKHFLLDCPGYIRERKEMYDNIRSRTSRIYDFKLMIHDTRWLMDALIGRNIGEVPDRSIIRYEVGEYLLKAFNLRRVSLGQEAE